MKKFDIEFETKMRLEQARFKEEARAGNANEGTGNQAPTIGGRARARAQSEENSIRER